MGRKKTSGRYWTDDTELAVVEYIRASGDRERNRIFNHHLHIPLKKISEIYCNSIDTGYTGEEVDDLINDCLTHLITSTILTFNPESGKAYSYFSVSAKYWVMQRNMKGYREAKSNRTSDPLDGLDWMEDESIKDDVYDSMFIERYYAFIDWFKMHLPELYYTKTIKLHMWMVLEFMQDGLDVIDDYLKIRVNEKFREKYPESHDTMARYARANIYEQYLHFIKEWERGVINPTPVETKPVGYVRAPRIKDLNGGGPEKNKNRRNYSRYYKSKKKSSY
jgi:hypothetical protein